MVRGLALVNDLAVIRALYGEAMVTRFSERLTPAQRATFDEGFLPGRWYDEDLQARLCAAVRESVDDAALVRIGCAIVRYHVSRTQRFLARLAGPRRVLERSAGLWSYWRDTGRLVVEQETAASARVVILDHPLMAQPSYALLYASASVAILHLSGARSVRFWLDLDEPRRIVAHVRWAPHASDGLDAHAHRIDKAMASLPPKL